MFSASLSMLPAAITNGLMYGAIYALVALGLTLIYGVLHIINFAHGAMLMLALYAAFFLFHLFGIDPYLAIVIVTPAAFVFGYVIYRWGVGKLSGGRDQNILLITLGLSIIIENGALFFFTGDQQTVSLSYSYEAVDLGFVFLVLSKDHFFLRLAADLPVVVGVDDKDRSRACHPRSCQATGRRAPCRHRCREYLCHYLWHWHRLPWRGGMHVAADLLC